MKHTIRRATIADSKDILNIYSHYIKNTTITSEITVPTLEDFSNRIANISAFYPYLVYEIDERIVGYAYASKHAEREGYCYDVNLSVYILHEYHSRDIAQKLYDCLFSILKKQGFYNAYAGFSVPNHRSEKFHKKYGFTEVGTYHNAGYKFGEWRDVTFLEKTIQPYQKNPKSLKAIEAIDQDFLNEVFALSTSLAL